MVYLQPWQQSYCSAGQVARQHIGNGVVEAWDMEHTQSDVRGDENAYYEQEDVIISVSRAEGVEHLDAVQGVSVYKETAGVQSLA